ncbi:carboxypeptidase regulatory-like domain-containing protein [Moheibacter sediminis]|uniref:Carboxypeptidase regulatory-like domain-containing protein n=1 Tax=Moheibacter sediminis TaxID=1434700 RepID=A0A1W1ZJW9_9FLAO|nr:carboxypeptidase regulatory-like domain-containing protein [Moheibacter sediminis]SMC48799.1 Carboxypeptidase regulatory-like domain-containing protein [Moheibacter sediminis]
MKIQGLISGLVFMSAIVLLANGNKTGLTGKIQDESGFGIISSSLEVYDINSKHKLIYKGDSQENGTYMLSDLKPGEYKFIVKAKGFDDKIETVKVESTSFDLGTIVLCENDISLNEAVIYGKASQKEVVILDEVVIYGKAK